MYNYYSEPEKHVGCMLNIMANSTTSFNILKALLALSTKGVTGKFSQ